MTNDTATETPNRWRSADGRFAVSLVHFNVGWRYWAFEVDTGYDTECGLRADGYASMEAAQSAVKGAA